MSVRINLLPHREERRKRARQHFGVLAGLAAVVGIAIVGAMHIVNAQRIDAQSDRNAFLKSEIAKLDKQIDEIKKLRDEIAALLARKQVIETLQADRAQTVHLLDELVSVMPEGCVRALVPPARSPGQPNRLLAIERARVDADAQHRRVTVARESRASGDSARHRSPTSVSTSST
jgi:Tfp pilus assembly protein PilN